VICFLAEAAVEETRFQQAFQNFKDQLGKSWDSLRKQKGDLLFVVLKDHAMGVYEFRIEEREAELVWGHRADSGFFSSYTHMVCARDFDSTSSTQIICWRMIRFGEMLQQLRNLIEIMLE